MITFFAVVCAALGLGAQVRCMQGYEESQDPYFFYALSQEAIGVWEIFALSKLSGASDGPAAEGENKNERIKCLQVCLVALLLRGAGSGNDEVKCALKACVHFLLRPFINIFDDAVDGQAGHDCMIS